MREDGGCEVCCGCGVELPQCVLLSVPGKCVCDASRDMVVLTFCGFFSQKVGGVVVGVVGCVNESFDHL